MILDKLIEKKDLLLYIELKKDELSNDFNVKDYPIKERECKRQRNLGRIKELDKLKSLIVTGKLKRVSKELYKDVKKRG